MKAKDPPRFDIDALRRLVGEKVFARGESYHRAGQVQILLIEPQRVLAQVAGTEDYRTELVGRSNRIDRAYSCPAFADWGFCKHIVAVALTANAAGSGAGAEGVGALSRIRDHLRQKGVDALVSMIVDLAERDPALFRKLDIAAAVLDADEETIRKHLRKAIDGATRTRGYVEYGEAGGWAAGVDELSTALPNLHRGHAPTSRSSSRNTPSTGSSRPSRVSMIRTVTMARCSSARAMSTSLRPLRRGPHPCNLHASFSHANWRVIMTPSPTP